MGQGGISRTSQKNKAKLPNSNKRLVSHPMLGELPASHEFSSFVASNYAPALVGAWMQSGHSLDPLKLSQLDLVIPQLPPYETDNAFPISPCGSFCWLLARMTMPFLWTRCLLPTTFCDLIKRRLRLTKNSHSTGTFLADIGGTSDPFLVDTIVISCFIHLRIGNEKKNINWKHALCTPFRASRKKQPNLYDVISAKHPAVSCLARYKLRCQCYWDAQAPLDSSLPSTMHPKYHPSLLRDHAVDWARQGTSGQVWLEPTQTFLFVLSLWRSNKNYPIEGRVDETELLDLALPPDWEITKELTPTCRSRIEASLANSVQQFMPPFPSSLFGIFNPEVQPCHSDEDGDVWAELDKFLRLRMRSPQVHKVFGLGMQLSCSWQLAKIIL